MASRNPLEKRILRRCPGVVDGRGRELEVSLDPADGGSILLRWSGDKGGPFRTVPLRDLALDDAPGTVAEEGADAPPAKQETRKAAPSMDLEKWVSYEAFLSFLHVAPVATVKERTAMVGIVSVLRDFRRYRAWIAGGASCSWERWKERYSDEALMASIPEAEWPEGAGGEDE
jgi:hypothetical protein